jgi:hypothetical protein
MFELREACSLCSSINHHIVSFLVLYNVHCVHKAHSGFWKIVYYEYVALSVSLNVGVTIHTKLEVWIL